MNLSATIGAIYEGLLQLTPLFRVVWVSSVVIGVVMVVIAALLKKNPVRKKSPWIVGGIGLLLALSSGSQLIFSFVN